MSISTRRLLPALVALLAANLAGAAAVDASGGLEPPATSDAAASAAAGPTSSIRRMALGVSMWLPERRGISPEGPYDLQVIDDFTAASGRVPAIWAVWSDWGGPNSEFPTELMAGLRDRGAVPMVYWQPIDPAHRGSGAYRYRNIIDGLHDYYIREWATQAKVNGGPIIVRWAHEFDGYWFPWSVHEFDNTPRRFKRAWRHIWRIFKGPDGVGATNVRFLWSPNNPCGRCIDWDLLYPGDGYVDYVGFTWFNWSTPYLWRSMEGGFERSMAALRRLTKKRVIVAETGSSPIGGSKPAWIRNGYPAVYARWPRIKAIVYFHVDALAIANQVDWRLTTPERGLRRYRDLLTRPEFQGTIG